MKKPFSFDKRSEKVSCSNTKCSVVRGAEGVARMPIKENVLYRQTKIKPLMCYDCSIFFRTGKNRHQRKEAARMRKAQRVAANREMGLRTLAVNA